MAKLLLRIFLAFILSACAFAADKRSTNAIKILAPQKNPPSFNFDKAIKPIDLEVFWFENAQQQLTAQGTVDLSDKLRGALRMSNSKSNPRARSNFWLRSKVNLEEDVVYESQFSYQVYDCAPKHNCWSAVGFALQSEGDNWAPNVQSPNPLSFGLLPNARKDDKRLIVGTVIDSPKGLSLGFGLANNDLPQIASQMNEVVESDPARDSDIIHSVVYFSKNRFTIQSRRAETPFFSPPVVSYVSDLRKVLDNSEAWMGIVAASGQQLGSFAFNSLDLHNITLKSFSPRATSDVITDFSNLKDWQTFGPLKPARNALQLLNRKWDYRRQSGASLWYRNPFRLTDRSYLTFEYTFLTDASDDVSYGSGFSFVLSPFSSSSPPGTLVGSYGACFEQNFLSKHGSVVFVSFNSLKSQFELSTCWPNQDKFIRATLPVTDTIDSFLTVRLRVEPRQIGVQYRVMGRKNWSPMVFWDATIREVLDDSFYTFAGFASQSVPEEDSDLRPNVLLHSFNATIFEDLCQPDPCNTKGRCMVQDNKAVCECNYGFAGTFCDEEDPGAIRAQIESQKEEMEAMRELINKNQAEVDSKVAEVHAQKLTKLNIINSALQKALQAAKTQADESLLTAEKEEEVKMGQQRAALQVEMEKLDVELKKKISDAEQIKDAAVAVAQAKIDRARKEMVEVRQYDAEAGLRLEESLAITEAKMQPLKDKYESEIEQAKVESLSREDVLQDRLTTIEQQIAEERTGIQLEREQMENQISRRRGELEREASQFVSAARKRAQQQTDEMQARAERVAAVAKSKAEGAKKSMQGDRAFIKAQQTQKRLLEDAVRKAQEMRDRFEQKATEQVSALDKKLERLSAKLESERASAATELAKVKAQLQDRIRKILTKEEQAELSAANHDHVMEMKRQDSNQEAQAKERALQELIDQGRAEEERAREQAELAERVLREEYQDKTAALRRQIKTTDAAVETTLEFAKKATEYMGDSISQSAQLAIDKVINPDIYPTEDPHMMPLPKNYVILPAQGLVDVRLAQGYNNAADIMQAEKRLFTLPTESPSHIGEVDAYDSPIALPVSDLESARQADYVDENYLGGEYLGFTAEQLQADPLAVLAKEVEPTMLPPISSF